MGTKWKLQCHAKTAFFLLLLETEIHTMMCLIATMKSHLIKRTIYLNNVFNSKDVWLYFI